MQNGEEKKKITRKDEKLKNKKDKIALKQKLPILIFALITLVTLTIALLGSKFHRIESQPMGEIARSMEYQKVNAGEENVAGTNDCVEFDAFFLRDLNNDGVAESIRGTCKQVGEQSTLYMELNVKTNGHLENGVITIEGKNFYLRTSIPKDKEVKDNAIGDNVKTINLNTLNVGTQKMLTGIVTPYIGNDTKNYSQKGKVTLTGTYISDDGSVNEQITKEAEFDVDWHGTVGATITNTSQKGNVESAIDEENDKLKLNFSVSARETKEQLILKKSILTGTIPLLNEYEPETVECTSGSTNFVYNDETREFTIERESVLNEETKIVTSTISRNPSYNICVTYPLDAYRSLGADTIEIKIPVKAYFEGHNNTNEEFRNPEVSNIAQTTIIASYRKPTGSVAIFDVTVGKMLYNPTSRYMVSKVKPLRIYNGLSSEEKDDNYIVRWYGYTGTSGKSTGMVMKETKDGLAQVSDQFTKTSSTSESMENVTSNIGIYFSNCIELLGEEGEIKVYDDELDELLVTFNKDDWNKYSSSNPYYYKMPVKHIRVETSATNANSSIYVYNIKQLNDEYITENYEKEEFDSFQYIKSTLSGYVGGTFINTDTHSASYEAPYSIASIRSNKSTFSTQVTEKNVELTIEADATESNNQVQWQNGAFLVKLPKEIIEVQINSIKCINSDVKILSYEKYKEGDNYYIKVNTENNTPTTYSIEINCDISPNPTAVTQTQSIELYYTNENTAEYWNKTKDVYDVNSNLNVEENIGRASKSISLVSPNSLLTSETITDYDDNGSITIAPQIAEVEKSQNTAKINLQLTNNYTSTISEVKVLGRIPFTGNKYVINGGELGSSFNTTLQGKITLPKELEKIVKVYYSENIDATRDLYSEENNWQENPKDFSNIKSYLIDFGNEKISKNGKYEISYIVEMPVDAKYNQISYSHHAVYFSLDTTEGKYRTQTEPNKIGLMIAKKYKLEITKYQLGRSNTVQGATYFIKEEGQEEGKTKITGQDGTLKLADLYVDRTYVIKEIKSPANYELNEKEVKFRVTEQDGELKLVEEQTTTENARAIRVVQPQDGEGYKVQVELEDEVKAKLKIIKTAEGEEDINLRNVRFRLIGKHFENGRIITTDARGTIILSGLGIGEEYTLEETKAEGYYLAKPIKFTIVNEEGSYKAEITEEDEQHLVKNTIIEEKENIPEITLNIENEKIPEYTLKIKKVVKGEETPLEGAKFRLYKGTEKIEDYITDDQGSITITNLYEYERTRKVDQTYTLKELLAPDGYAQVKDITFYVTRNTEGLLTMQVQSGKVKNQTVDEETKTVTIIIEDNPAFKLIKKDGETDEPLANTKFAIYNVDDGTEQLALDSKYNILGEKEVIDGKTYYTLTTNDKGEIEANLREGLYKAVEIQANDDKYDITSNTYYFGIGASREATYQKAFSIMTTSDFNGDYILATSDGGYVVSGKKGIKKFTEDIELEWFQTEACEDVIETTNGDYIAKYSSGIKKYSSTGELIWTKNLEGITLHIAATNDGGFIIGGSWLGKKGSTIRIGEYTFTNNSTYTGGISSEYTRDGLIIKYGATGEVEWATNLGGSDNDTIASVKQTNDGGFIAIGNFNSTIKIGNTTLISKGESDILIVKYNNSGEVEWVTDFGGDGDERIYALAACEDGGFIIGGSFYSANIDIGDYILTNRNKYYEDGMIIKYKPDNSSTLENKSYSVDWTKILSGEYWERINQIETTKDGGYIVSATVGSPNATLDGHNVGKVDGGHGSCYNNQVFAKLSKFGNVEFTKNFNTQTYELGTTIKMSETIDGRYMLAGDGICACFDVERISFINKSSKYIGNSYSSIVSAVSTNDDGYVIGVNFEGPVTVENRQIYNNGNYDGLIVKYNSKNEIEWTTSFGGDGYEYIKTIFQTEDGGYIVVGKYNSKILRIEDYTLYNNGDYDGVMIKYDNKGNIEWAQSIGGSKFEEITSVSQTHNDEYTIVGHFEGNIQVGNYALNNQGSKDSMIVKYDKNGKVKWATSFGTINEDKIKCIVSTSDGGYIVGGEFKGELIINNHQLNNEDFTALIIKYNRNNEIEWLEPFQGGKTTSINSIVETNNGNYIVAGEYMRSNNSNYPIAYIIKYNKNGQVMNQKVIGTVDVNQSSINSITTTKDGGYIVGGSFNGSEIELNGYKLNSGAMLIKYDNSDQVKWVQTVSGSSTLVVTELEDSTILVCGNDRRISRIASIEKVPEVEELEVKNYRKEFKITTDVEEIDGKKGGSISGEDKKAYETVKYGDSNTLDIVMEPEDDNHEIIRITVNGINQKFTANEDGSYTLPKFNNVQEDKHIVVTYATKTNKITIKKVDSKTGEPIEGINFKLDQIEERVEPENVLEDIVDNGTIYYELNEEKELASDVKGVLTDNGAIYKEPNEEKEVTSEVKGVPTDNGAIYKEPNEEKEVTSEVKGTLTENGATYIEPQTENEVKDVDLTLEKNGDYYFETADDGTYIPTNSLTYQKTQGKTTGVANQTAHSYIKIDLSGKQGTYAVVVNASVSSESYDHGYATITTTETAPEYGDKTGQFIDIAGTQTAQNYTSMELIGGNTYYLHLGYKKDESVDTNADQIVIHSVKLYPAIASSYNFVDEGGTYKPNNQGKPNTTANSYIPIDLKDKEGKYYVVVNARVSSQSSYDYGYATITTTQTAPTYSASSGQFMKISGTVDSKDYISSALDGKTTYYLHLGYYKNGSTDTNEDQVVINSIKVYEEKEIKYGFVQDENGGYKSNNQGKPNTTANSYIPINLKDKEGKYIVVVNASISSFYDEHGDMEPHYGYATINTSTTAPSYGTSSGQFMRIYGTINNKDYMSSVLNGGTTYYLHLGYYKNRNTSVGDDQLVINSIKVYETKDVEYGFVQGENGEYKPNNQGKRNTTANSCIPINLKDKEGKYFVVVNARISSGYSDYGYATINTSKTAPSYGTSSGQFMRISGTVDSKDYVSSALDGKTTYYLHLGYYKNGNTDANEDQLVINSIKVYEAKDVKYGFVQDENGEYKSNNQGRIGTTANSCIPINLKDCTGKYNLTFKAKVSSQYNNYGYVTVNQNANAPQYSDYTGRLVLIQGTSNTEFTEFTEYSTVLDGGYQYYLHLGFYKPTYTSSGDAGEDTFTVKDINVSLNDSELYHTTVETNQEGIAVTQIPYGRYSITEINTPEGYIELEEPIVIDFKEDNKQIVTNPRNVAEYVAETNEYVIGNIPYPKVIVHHYLKKADGTETTEEVAPTEEMFGKPEEKYETRPHIDLDKYEPQKDDDGNYIIPPEANGEYGEEDKVVNYYYVEKKIPLTVHHYIEGTENKVPLADGTEAEDEKQYGIENEKYTTNSKTEEELSAEYKLSTTPVNSEGVFKYTEVEVTYYYDLKDSPGVIVHHVDHTTKEKIADDVTLPTEGTAKYGDSYVTQVAEDLPANYELVVTPENAEGTMTDKLTEVTYEYSLKTPEITNQNITKEATEKISSVKEEVIYTVNYTATIDEYIGKAQITVVDTLPYSIDVSKSNLEGGEYSEENHTITWQEIEDGIDTFEAGEAKQINFSKTIKVVFNDIDVTQSNIINTVKGKVKLYTPETESEDVTDEANTELNLKTKLKVVKEWVDSNNVASKRPTQVKILLKNKNNLDDVVDEIILTADYRNSENENIWEYTFDAVPKYNEDGTEAEYVVEETEVQADELKFYEKNVEKVEENDEESNSEDSVQTYKATNTFKVPKETIEIPVTKVWNHTNNSYEKPTRVKVQVVKMVNGEKQVVAEQELTNANKEDKENKEDNEDTWKYTFTNLQKYDDFGNEISYLLEEQEVEPGELLYYNTSISQEEKTITNTYVGPIITQNKSYSTENNLSYVQEGEKITYTIVVENAGSIAKDVVIKDNIPNGTTFVPRSIKVNKLGTYLIDGEQVDLSTYTEENLKEGIKVNVPAKINASQEQEVKNGQVVLSFEVTVNELEEGTITKQLTNIAAVDGKETNEAKVLVNKTNVTYQKTSIPETGSKVEPGDEITYKIEIQNTGTAQADVNVIDSIPEGTTYVEDSLNITREEISAIKTYAIEELTDGMNLKVAPGEKVTVEFRVKVNYGLANGTVITNTAQVDKKNTETTEHIVKVPKISIEKEAQLEKESNYVVKGDIITYNITVRNTGDKGTIVLIKDNIPEKTSFGEGSIKINGMSVYKLPEEVSAGSTEVDLTQKTEDDLKEGIEVYVAEKGSAISSAATLSFKVKVNEDAQGEIRNKAQVQDKENPEDEGKESEEVLYPVLSIEKQAQITRKTEEVQNIEEGKVTADDEITYNITVRNTGKTDAKNVEVKDVVPEGTIIKQVNNNGTIKSEKEISWLIDSITAGEEKTVSFTVTVSYSQEERQIKNTAYVKDAPSNETVTEYTRPEISLKTNVVKDGSNKITDSNLPIYYEIVYTGTINSFVGKAQITIVDNLPYEIDESKSELNGGTYNREAKTITWVETIENIDTYLSKEEKVITRRKVISLQYIYTDEETLSGNIENVVTAKTELKEPNQENPLEDKVVKTEEKQDNHIVIAEIPTKLIVHHYFYDKETGEKTTIELAPSVEKEGLVGEKYTTRKSDEVPANYECVEENPENKEGKLTKTPIEVIYYYALKDEKLTVEVAKQATANKVNAISSNILDASNVMENINNIAKVNDVTNGNVSTIVAPKTVAVLTKEGGAVKYKITYKVRIEKYIGKAKITIADTLPAEIDVDSSDLQNGQYNKTTNTITWEETIEDIDTFADGTYEKTIEKEIEVVYVGQNKVQTLENTVEGKVTTYYPDIHPNKPGEEKEEITDKDTAKVEQDYRKDVVVEKRWDDNENIKKHRPNSVKVQLTANGEETYVGVAEHSGEILPNALLTKDNSWSYTFKDLYKYDSLGNEIEYSVKESEVKSNDLEYYEAPEVIAVRPEVEEQESKEQTNKDKNVNTTEKIIVTNSYKLVNTEIESTITKDGTEEITTSKDKVKYHITYNAVVTDYIGEATLKIIDTLPYRIDKEASNLNGGTYDDDLQTVTWVKELGHINTTKNGNKEVSFEKEIEVVFKDLDANKESMTNIVKGRIEFTENDTKNEVEDTHETEINIMGRIILRYVDINTGKDITRTVMPGEKGNEDGTEPIEVPYRYESTGKVGANYITEKKNIPTYDYVKDSGNTVGNIIEGTIEVIYYYDRSQSGGVTVKYVDEEGNDLLPEKKIEGKIDEDYKTEKEDIENYEFVEVTGDEPEGKLGVEPKEVVYHYKKIPAKVVVRFLEKTKEQAPEDPSEEATPGEPGEGEGNPNVSEPTNPGEGEGSPEQDKPNDNKPEEKVLAPEVVIEGYVGDNYETTRKAIENYRAAEPEPDNATGKMEKNDQDNTIYVTYYYEKIPSGKITVKYVDIDTGEEIIYMEEGKAKTYREEMQDYVGEKYEANEKEIPYYDYLEDLKPTNREGLYTEDDDTVVYYYRRLPFNISVEKKIVEAIMNGKEVNVRDGKIIKLEVVASKVGSTEIQVRYEIEVRNTGAIDGTAYVEEKIPSGLRVSSKTPDYWERENGKLTSKVEVKAGESKKLEVVLDWENSNNNFGNMRNIVEITNTENPANYAETNKEDNTSKAEVIISVKTGAERKILVVLLGTIAIVGGLILIYQYETYQKERGREIRHVVLEGKNVVIRKKKQK